MVNAPRDPYEIVGYDDIITEDGVEHRPVRVIDRVETTLRMNGFMHDAAARAGISPDKLRIWRGKGNRANSAILEGRKRYSELDTLTKRCIELARRMDLAEAESRSVLLDTANRLAVGGLERKRLVQKRDMRTGDVVEVTEETTTMLPDPRMITWLLTHRYPQDFPAQRVEISGPAGGPVEVEITARDRLLDAIEAVQKRSELGPEIGPEGNGHRAIYAPSSEVE